jgi:tetratricopeptide (TPR) repeat protein
MVVRDFQLNEMGTDSFFSRQQLLNIDPVKASQIKNVERLAKRANTLYRLGGETGMYFNSFKPLLSTQKELAYRFFYHSSFYDIHKGKYDEAEKLLKTSLFLNPEHYLAHTRIAKVYEARGQSQQAVDSYKKALQIKPQYIEAALGLGKLIAYDNNYNEAIKVYNDCIEANLNSKTKSNLADIYLALGYALKSNGNTDNSLEAFKNAASEYKTALLSNPDSVDVLINAADAMENIGNLKDTTDLLRKAVAIDPYDVDLHIGLAMSLEKQNLYDETALALQNALDLTSYLGTDQTLQKKLTDYITAFKKRTAVKNN